MKKEEKQQPEAQSNDVFFHALCEMADVGKFFRAYCYRSVVEQGFSINEIDVLISLKEHPEKNTVKGISETMHLSKGMISQAVESLRKKQMVTVDHNEHDRRSVMIELNQPAHPILEKVKESSTNFIKSISKGIPNEQICEISKVVTQICNNKESMKSSAHPSEKTE